MHCKLSDSCHHSLGCNHKDVADYCNYHLLNYVDQTTKEFKGKVYPNLNTPQKPVDFDKVREDRMNNPLDPYEKD